MPDASASLSYGQRLLRVEQFCAGSCTDDLVVAVSHVSPIKAAVCLALGVDERATWHMFLDVASVSRVGRRPDGARYLLGFNDVSHLSGVGS